MNLLNNSIDLIKVNNLMYNTVGHFLIVQSKVLKSVNACGTSKSADFPSLILDGVALLQTGPICNLRVLDLQSSTLQYTVGDNCGQTPFAQLYPVLLDWEALCQVTHTSITSQLDYSSVVYLGLSLTITLKLLLVQNAACGQLWACMICPCSNRTLQAVTVTSMFQLQQLPVLFFFQDQITCRTVYLSICLFK